MATACQTLDCIDEQRLNHQVHIDRDAFTQYTFDAAYGYVERTRACNCRTIIYRGSNLIRGNCRCSIEKIKLFFLIHLPILCWLPKYSLRRDLIYDIIGGLTVGVMHIPQGMAYGMLAGLDQVNGLYTSFFASLIYVFLGTSRHVSIGTFAVISMMMGNLRERLIPKSDPNITNFEASNTTAPPDFPIDATPVELATSVTILVGIILLCMGILRLGFLTSYLSDSLISGFTTGAAVHVLFTQLPPILGVKKPKCGEIGKLWCTLAHLINVIKTVNLVTLGIASTCIIIVYVMKEYISPILKRKTNLPLPGELIAIIVGTTASYFGGFGPKFKVEIVGPMPTGLPPATLPRIDLFPWIIGDSISIAIVIFSVTVSVAKIFAKKHKYKIDPNQELIALGFVQSFCSLFACFPPSGSLARSALFESTGTRTQIAAVIGCGVVLTVLLWLGPLFYALPTCILAAIIVVALKGMFMQFRECKSLFGISKIDAVIWISSFLAVLCLGVTFGLGLAVAIGLFTLILRLQWPDATLLNLIPGTELYKDRRCYTEGQSVCGIKIFRFDAPLNFANVERFKSDLFEICDVNIEKTKKYLRTCPAFPPSPPGAGHLLSTDSANGSSTPVGATKEPRDENGNDDEVGDPSASHDISANSSSPAIAGMISLRSPDLDPMITEYIIIDCSTFGYVDVMGLEALKQVYQDLTALGIRVLFASCKAPLRSMFEASGFHKTVPEQCFFITVHDAVTIATAGNIVGIKTGTSSFLH